MKLDYCFIGDCRDSMRDMLASGYSGKIQCVVTSPPYFGLRDYGHEEQIGLEKTPDEYIAALVDVFRAVRGLLADDGTLWLNIADSYAGGKTGRGDAGKDIGGRGGNKLGSGNPGRGIHRKVADGYKPKDLIGIPWMLAFALRADGWNLRQDIIWHKPNPMPESVTDRCTKAHEYLFLLSKNKRYFFDHEAMQEQAATASIGRWAQNVEAQTGSDRVPGKTNGKMKAVGGPRSKRDSFKREDSKRAEVIPGQTVGAHRNDRAESEWDTATRNRRSVWTVPTVPYSGAHFATFPPALVEPCILAGSRPGDIVFDPFLGSGTVAHVAQNLGRHWLGCELNSEYIELQSERTRQKSLVM